MPLQAAQSSLNSLALCCCHAAERAEVVPARDHGCERERVESHPRVGRLSRTRCAMLFVLRHLAEVLKFVPTQTRLASSACCRCSSRALASPCITWCVFLLGPVLRTLLFPCRARWRPISRWSWTIACSPLFAACRRTCPSWSSSRKKRKKPKPQADPCQALRGVTRSDFAFSHFFLLPAAVVTSLLLSPIGHFKPFHLTVVQSSRGEAYLTHAKFMRRRSPGYATIIALWRHI